MFSLPDFGLSEYMLGIVRIIAMIGGAVVGWFVCDPLTRLAYRLWYRAATPWLLLVFTKGTAAATMALLLYLVPLGGGGGGLGFGPGMGGSPGKGAGQGDKAIAAAKDSKTDDKKSDDPKKDRTLESVEIEIIGVKRFQDDGKDRFFIVNHAEPALSHDELDIYLQKNHAKIEVTPVLTNDSIGVDRDNSPLSQLLALTKKHAVKTLTPKTPPS